MTDDPAIPDPGPVPPVDPQGGYEEDRGMV